MSENKLIQFKNSDEDEISIQVRSNDPALESGKVRIWFNTTSQQLKYCDGVITRIQIIPYTRIDDSTFKKLNQNNSKKIFSNTSNTLVFDVDCHDYTAIVSIENNRGSQSLFNIDLNSMQENVFYTLRLFMTKQEGVGLPVRKEIGFLSTIHREVNGLINNSCLLYLTKIDNNLNIKIEKNLLEIKGMTQNWGWGYNQVGELGTGLSGSTAHKSSPVQVINESDFVAISAGGQNTLALKADGRVFSWGDNFVGQLGDGATINKSSPVQVINESDFVAISAGSYHSLALKADGRVFAWGDNLYGKLGDGATINKSSPVQVINESDFVAISAGESHSLALKADGRVFAWGDNFYGQLGDGLSGSIAQKSSPVQVINESDFVAISAGITYSLALKADGRVFAWGYNLYGQLGINFNTSRSSPVQVIGQSDFVAISAGSNYSLALKADGRVFAWGINDYGELGTNLSGFASYRSSPVQVVIQSDFIAIDAGYSHSLALKADGRIFAWGNYNYGSIGDGFNVNRSSPVQVIGQSDFVAISAGGVQSLGIKKI